MTRTTIISKAQYAGDGATVSFPTTFKFEVNSHVKVILTDALGVDTTWVEGTQYTLTGAGADTGGPVLVKTSPTDFTPQIGETLTIKLDAPETQATALPSGGPFPSTSVETMVDQAIANIQQHSEELKRALQYPETEDETTSGVLPSKASRASKFFGWDANSEPIPAAGTSADLGPVSAFINTLLDDVDADTALATLTALKDVMTTRGDITAEGASGPMRVAIGTSGQALISDGTDPGYADIPLPLEHISGLTLTNNSGDAAHDIDIGAGVARDDGNAANMVLSSTLVKQINAAWSVGTNQGGLDGTESVPGTPDASTWYHVWLIRRSDTGVADALFSESATSPTMPTSYDQKRWIGAVKTDGSANILAFHFQPRDRWFWHVTPIEDYNSAADISSGTTVAILSAPTGFECEWTGLGFASRAATSNILLHIRHPSLLDPPSAQAEVGGGQPGAAAGGNSNESGQVTALTDASAQLHLKTNANPTSVVVAGRRWRRADG